MAIQRCMDQDITRGSANAAGISRLLKAARQDNRGISTQMPMAWEAVAGCYGFDSRRNAPKITLVDESRHAQIVRRKPRARQGRIPLHTSWIVKYIQDRSLIMSHFY